MRTALSTMALGAAAILWSLASPAAAGPPSISLSGVPERLELPMPRGSNKIITARVEGAEAEAVWLATGEGAERTLPLVAAGRGWAVNLSDPRLTPLARGHALFQIFARLEGGEVVASLPVSYAMRPPARTRVWAVLKAPRARHPVFVDHERPPPFSPEAVVRLQASRGADPGPNGPQLRAYAGAVSRVFTQQPDGRYTLPMDAALRAAWRAANALSVVDDLGPYPPLVIPAAPSDLKGQDLPAKLTVYQRRSASVPGTNGWLTVQLGDITGGKVMVSLLDAHGSPIRPKALLAEGEALPFSLGQKRYTVRIEKMVNLLVGEDYAELEVASARSVDTVNRRLP